MPSDPEKAIEYVRIFLPGFVCLGLIGYITGYALRDFTFAYVAVALSLLIYGIADGVHLIGRWLMEKLSSKKCEELQGPELPGVWSLRMRLITSAFVTLALTVGVVILLENHVVLSTMNYLMDKTVLKDDDLTPLRSILRAEAKGRIHDLNARFDVRQPPFRLSGDRKASPAPYKVYVRVAIDSNTLYEGRIIRFDTDATNSDAFPVLLSPACRVLVRQGHPDQMVRITGPGVYLSGKDLKSMELFEAEASQCRRCFVAVDGKPPDDCLDSHSSVPKPARSDR